MSAEEKHIADYFIISGIAEGLGATSETKPLVNPILPITDITVIFRGLGEQCPEGYTCIETTPGGHSADLNNGNFKSQNILICYRRGDDKPPLVDIGVYHEDKERVLPDVGIVSKTPEGRCASTGNIGSKSGTFITYRRAKTNQPFNQLVVVDLCVILNNKSEHPPHAFYPIKKNLNKSLYGMIGSEVFLCYRKTILSPPSLSYTPQIISRFPLQDYANFPLPETVPLFCLPAGASIELWPTAFSPSRPTVSTFVLTSNSAQKIYGSALSFHEAFDISRLSDEQRNRLGISGDDELQDYELYAVKSICILSRWPFFDCFEKFLLFLHRLVFNPKYFEFDSSSHKNRIPLEHHISHFLLDVSFPTPQRPTVLVQLMPGCDDEVAISQPSSAFPLPMTGASFGHLLLSLGVDNTMNLLLFGLSEQKILLHCLHPFKLTGIAEAITAMLFPFHWQCPYVPLCPMSLHGILQAPLPFIVGIDSRCFDTFSPPSDIICIDLDTKAIYLSELKKNLSLRILPKRPARVLRNSLERIYQKLVRIQALGTNQSPQFRSDLKRQNVAKQIELEIQEAFLRFMVMILRGFRSYLLPITKAPTVGATDPTSLFDFDGFLASRDRNHGQFFHLITKTQMFTHYIEERSFVSDKTSTGLAFFDDCEERLFSLDDNSNDKPIKLVDLESNIGRTDRSVYIPAPEQSPSVSSSNSFVDEHSTESRRTIKFGPLNPALFHKHPQTACFPSLDQALNNGNLIGDHSPVGNLLSDPNSSFSISRRTEQEIKASQKLAKKSSKCPLDWSKYLVSCCYSLWFASLPSYISFCESETKGDIIQYSAGTSRILRYAYSTIVKMQKLALTTDEICFRVLTLLCGHYGQPALAVRVFFEMKKAGIRPNAVTYGYYNKAVLESKWPDHSSKPTTVLWSKMKNVISGVTLFKLHGKMRFERRNRNLLSPDANSRIPARDVVDRASFNGPDDYFHPTTIPIGRGLIKDTKGPFMYKDTHRRSLVNRSFSTNQKSSLDVNDVNIDSPETKVKTSMHKSQSMHIRDDDSPKQSSLVVTKSSSSDDDEDNLLGLNKRKSQSSLNVLAVSKDTKPSKDYSDKLSGDSANLMDRSAGILFSTKKNTSRLKTSAGAKHIVTEPSSENRITDANDLLNSNSFGEDAKILRKLESHEQKPISTNQPMMPSVGATTDDQGDLPVSSSNLFQEDSDDSSDDEDGSHSVLKYITSTPNFKLAGLINDASNVQWAKWTTSQNSKIVYKGIKSAATGIVTSFQELKSSFSNANTPSKSTDQSNQRSTVTRDMLQEWKNYFSHQTSRAQETDRDSDSIGSNDLLRLSNDEDSECQPEASEFGCYNELLLALEKHYSNLSSKDDLIDHLTSVSENDSDIALEIKMTTCSRCNVCRSLLHDEEIMERWSHNDSNFNTSCPYCHDKIVPLMSIFVEDLRLRNSSEESSECLVDLKSDSDETCSAKVSNVQLEQDNMSSSQTNQQNFIVPYLSPIVLRKELESVFESSSDSCLSSYKFVDEHPIIFWNLLWYFSRINVPTHLALLCLNAQSITNGKVIPEQWQDTRKVIVKTLWNHEKLKSEAGQALSNLWNIGDQ